MRDRPCGSWCRGIEEQLMGFRYWIARGLEGELCVGAKAMWEPKAR